MDARSEQTPESIAAAKAAMEQERRAIEAATGLRISDTGRVLARVVIVHCPRPGCAYAATAHREGQAINSVACHLVKVHCEQGAK